MFLKPTIISHYCYPSYLCYLLDGTFNSNAGMRLFSPDFSSGTQMKSYMFGYLRKIILSRRIQNVTLESAKKLLVY